MYIKRTIRIVYQDKKSKLQDLLQKDKLVSTRMKHLQYLATEICKVKKGFSPETMKEILFFQENENHNLRSGTNLANRNMHTAHFDTNTITRIGPKLWKLVPDEIKNASILPVFKSRIKTWTLLTFVRDHGFMEICPKQY